MTDATSEQFAANRVPLEVVAAFLREEGWPCEEIGDRLLLRSSYKGHHGAWLFYAHCRPEFDQCVFYSLAPYYAPEALRPAVAEFLTRANWGLIFGNFEFDYSDGEVRFKTSIQLYQTDLTAELLRPLVFGNVAAMDKYLPGLEAVIAQTQTPLEAVNAIEST